MTKPVYIVWGPAASGKTLNAKRIAYALGCDRIVEGTDCLRRLKPGTLALTNETPSAWYMPGYRWLYIEDVLALLNCKVTVVPA